MKYKKKKKKKATRHNHKSEAFFPLSLCSSSVTQNTESNRRQDKQKLNESCQPNCERELRDEKGKSGNNFVAAN